MAADQGFPSDLPLTASVLDRRADLRADPNLVVTLLGRRATRVLGLVGDVAPIDGGPHGPRLRLRAPEPGDLERLAIYLGEADGTAYVGVVEDGEPGEGEWATLRQVGADLEPLDAEVFCTTLALANWHRVHGHCARCGAATSPDLAGWIRRCPVDSSEHYPRTDMAIIVAVVDADDRILLARGRAFREGLMSVLAGFVEPGESLRTAVAREVFEETGVRVGEVTYLGDQPWPFPSSLMLGFRAGALTTDLVLQESEILAARWFTRDELTQALAEGSLLISTRLSISRRLLEDWFGGPIPERVSGRVGP